MLDVDALLAAPEPPKAPKPTRPIDREQLRRLAKRWQKASNAERQDLGVRLERVVNGEAYAEYGSRDDTTWRLVCALAKAVPHADPDALVDIFEQSIDIMGEPSRQAVREKLVRVYSESSYITTLRLGEGGKPLGTLGNAITVLEHHKEVSGLVGWNERSMRVVVRRPPPWDTSGPAYPREMRDDDGSRFSQWLGMIDIHVSGAVASEALATVSKLYAFDPFRDWLEGLQWDGQDRLDQWLVDYAGVTDTPYARSVSSKWVVGAVARAFTPGSKCDTMLILEGEQGKLKSSLLNALVGDDYFADSLGDITQKDSCLQLQGPVVIEIAELESFDRRESEAIKAFLARRFDRFRPPYGRNVQECPRRCIFAGTTNEEHYLKDRTGHRRFWPVACGDCTPNELRAARAQLWAEAVVRYRAGEQWWLDPETEALAKGEQNARETDDSWDDLISDAIRDGVRGDFLEGKGATWAIEPNATRLRSTDIMTRVLNIPKGLQNRSTQMRLGSVLRRLGWERFMGSNERFWVRTLQK